MTTHQTEPTEPTRDVASLVAAAIGDKAALEALIQTAPAGVLSQILTELPPGSLVGRVGEVTAHAPSVRAGM